MLSAVSARHREVTALVLLGVGLIWTYRLLVAPVLGALAGDNAIYISLAESLVSGQGYRDVYTSPLTAGGPPPLHAQYPPLLPTILTPLVGLFEHNFLVMRATMLAFVVCAMAAVYATLRRSAGPMIAGAIVLAWATVPVIYDSSCEIQTEYPYVCFSFVALYLADRLRQPGAPARAFQLALAVSLGLAVLVRSHGLALVAGVLLALLSTPRAPSRTLRARLGWALIPIIFACAVFAAWMARTHAAAQPLGKTEGVYMSQLLLKDPYRPDLGTIDFADLRWRIRRNVQVHFDHVAPLVLGEDWISAMPQIAGRNVATVLIGGLFVVGWAIAFIRRRGAMEWYTLAYMIVLLLWPFRAKRFLFPLAPLIFLYVVGAAAEGLALVRVSKLFLFTSTAPVPARLRPVVPALLLLAFLIVAHLYHQGRVQRFHVEYRRVAEVGVGILPIGDVHPLLADLEVAGFRHVGGPEYRAVHADEVGQRRAGNTSGEDVSVGHHEGGLIAAPRMAYQSHSLGVDQPAIRYCTHGGLQGPRRRDARVSGFENDIGLEHEVTL